MSIKKDTLALLWATSFGVCAFPGCHQELICSKTNDIIGHVCHIVARSPGGPRGNATFTQEELNAFDNLILLCPTHHAIVDGNTEKYTVDVLKDMKALHYLETKEHLQQGTPWQVNISQIYYLNVPRLASLPTKDYSLLNMDIMGTHFCLHELGFELNYILRSYKELLNKLDVCAVPLHSCWKTFRPGQIISFDDKFRTKNVPGLDEYNPNKFSLTGDLRYDPHVYIKSDNEKFVLTLDPKWLATTTSFVNFKMGWIDITGLAVVKSVDPEKIVATPYIIGTPKNELWDMLFGVGSS